MDIDRFDNSSQIGRIRARVVAYARIGRRALRRGVSPVELVATKFPFALPDRPRPASLSVELTDACNLRCDYCTNPTYPHPRSWLDESTFSSLLRDLDDFPVARLRVCGGEPTLHPDFDRYSAELARRCRFLSIVTNAQWRREAVADVLVAHYDLVEVSVDAGGRDLYERHRVGGSYERLERSLRALRDARDLTGSDALINVRLMVRPSTRDLMDVERARWSEIADSVMVQYVIEQRSRTSWSQDVYVPVQITSQAVPRCTMPFKDLPVRADGTVPVCHVNGTDVDPDRRILLGRIGETSLRDCWTGDTLRHVRRAHRRRDEVQLEFCRGCSGR